MVAARIEHSGVVEAHGTRRSSVRITSHSACGTCKAGSVRPGRGAGQDRGREESDAAQFAVGEQVIVGVRRSAGAVAVILAYVGALAVLLAVLVAAVAVLGWSEGRGALAALGAVGVYYCVLWLFRHKIEHTIHFSITKHY